MINGRVFDTTGTRPSAKSLLKSFVLTQRTNSEIRILSNIMKGCYKVFYSTLNNKNDLKILGYNIGMKYQEVTILCLKQHQSLGSQGKRVRVWQKESN